jgi:hypothetical protein
MSTQKRIRETRAANGKPDVGPGPAWLLLVYQLPTSPSRARVRTWRRLQDVGAIGLKNSVYVVPNSPQAREDLEWIKTEIIAMKGQASVLLSETLDPATEKEIIAAFQSTRQSEYAALAGEAEVLLKKLKGTRNIAAQRKSGAREARILRDRWEKLVAIDFYPVAGRNHAGALLEEIDRRLTRGHEPRKVISRQGEVAMPEEFHSKTWVTRPRPGIDRMSSAWLIRNFIDPKAKFTFAQKAEEVSGAVPFDMYGVRFGHQGNRCTFETLARTFNIRGAAIERIGQIVHNLDLKDEQYQVPEEAVVGRLVEGLRQLHPNDDELLDRGMEMFEALHRSFTHHPVAARASTGKGSRRRGASFLGLA